MKHFFVLGNNPALSVAEITSLYPDNKTGQYIHPDIFLFEEKINPTALIKKLGGTIKIGQVVTSIPKHDREQIKEKMFELVKEKNKNSEGKFKFGISCHGKCGVHAKDVGMDIKTRIKEEGESIRFVVSKEKTLSSVVVAQNKLDSKGVEVILILKGSEVLICYTEAVQDFKGLSFRDFSRPARDDRSGMLPPKLAQIMINLSGKVNNYSDNPITLLDPFCGSGTILMEASLMGVKNITGSDIANKAISDSLVNMEWVKNKLSFDKLRTSKLQIFKSSATEISNHLLINSVDVIVTEPFLGPQQGYPDVKKTTDELNKLYSDTLKEFKKILKKDGVIVMIWPVLKRGDQESLLNPDISGFKIKNPIPNIQYLEASERGTLIYGRDGQKVWREIVILTMINDKRFLRQAQDKK